MREVETWSAPSWPPCATRSSRTARSSSASRRSTRRARAPGLNARAAAAGVCRPRPLRAPGRGAADAGKAAVGRDQPAPRQPLHPLLARTCSPTRRAYALVLESEADLEGLPDEQTRGGRGGGQGPRAGRQVGDHQHPLGHGAVPHLRRPPRPAREGAEAVDRRAATTAASTTTTPLMSRDPEAAGREGELLGHPDLRPLGRRRPDGQDPGGGDEAAHDIWGPAMARAQRGGGGDAGRSPPPRAPTRRSRPGTTATTPRRCARRSTTSTRTR